MKKADFADALDHEFASCPHATTTGTAGHAVGATPGAVVRGLWGKIPFALLIKFLPIILDLISGGKTVQEIIDEVLALFKAGKQPVTTVT